MKILHRYSMLVSKPYWRVAWRCVLLIVLLVCGWWWATRLQFREIGNYPMASFRHVYLQTGMIFHEKDTTFCLRDWQGHTQWRVRTATPFFSPGSKHDPWGEGFAIDASDIKETFACVSAAGARLRYQCWQHGIPVADCYLNSLSALCPHLLLVNSHLALFWQVSNAAPQHHHNLLLLDGNREIGSGRLPSNAILLQKGVTLYAVLPNETDFYYLKMTLHDGRIGWQCCYRGTDKLTVLHQHSGSADEDHYIAHFSDGYILADNGAIYNPAGRVRGPSNWEHEIGDEGDRYAFEFQDNRVRINAVSRQDCWYLTPLGRSEGGGVSEDGRFISVHYWPRTNYTIYTAIHEYLPALNWLVEGSMNRVYFAYYERPGILRARDPIKLESCWKGPGTVNDVFNYDNIWNERILIIYLSGGMPGQPKSYRYVVYRW